MHRYPGQWWPLAAFYSVLALITLVCISWLERKRPVRADALAQTVLANR
jgi:hypothetical protein